MKKTTTDGQEDGQEDRQADEQREAPNVTK